MSKFMNNNFSIQLFIFFPEDMLILNNLMSLFMSNNLSSQLFTYIFSKTHP